MYISSKRKKKLIKENIKEKKIIRLNKLFASLQGFGERQENIKAVPS